MKDFHEPIDTLSAMKLFVQAIGLVFAAAIVSMGAAIAVAIYFVRDTVKLFKPVAVALLILSVGSTALAQDLPDSESRILRLEDGQRAPFSGLLAPESLFVDWRSRIVLLEARLELDASACAEKAQALERLSAERLSLAQRRADVLESLYQQRIAALAEELREAREEARPGFFEHPAFWFATGVLVTGAAAGLLAYAVR